MPNKALKENMDTSSPFLLSHFNDIINSSSFQNHLKSSDTTAVHKKKTYVMISVLPNISKVFENIFNQQISSRFGNIFSKQQFGFRRGFNGP